MRKIIFIILALLCNCTSENVEIEKVIDSDILVSSNIEDENVFIEAETVRLYECIPYSIDYSVERDGLLITINFIDVIKPNGCFFAFGPAKAKINLGNLEAGDYLIKFKLDGITTEANLTINTVSLIAISNEKNVLVKTTSYKIYSPINVGVYAI